MTSASDLRPYAGYTLPDATIVELPNHYRGKVRENYDLPGGRRILIATDRMSAFDVNLAVIPLKGHVWTAPAVQEESDVSAKRSGAAMYPACFRLEDCPVAMQPQWPLALM